MRPKTYVGLIGLIVLFAGIGTQSVVAIVIALAVIGAAWLVKWPSDNLGAEQRQAERDERVRKLARLVRR